MNTEDTGPKVIWSGTNESTPRIETLLRLAQEVGPMEVEITEKDVQRLVQVPAEERDGSLGALVKAKFLGEERAALEILMRKDKAADQRLLDKLRAEGKEELADALIEAGATRRTYTLGGEPSEYKMRE